VLSVKETTPAGGPFTTNNLVFALLRDIPYGAACVCRHWRSFVILSLDPDMRAVSDHDKHHKEGSERRIMNSSGQYKFQKKNISDHTKDRSPRE
jgi:hypothetical protein